MKVVIPVAGIGSRLKPHTFTTPKPLMEVAGKPILDYIVEDCLKLNPDEIIFVVGHKAESIIEYVEKKFPKLKTSFIEQRIRDGDGSAIRLALERFEVEDDEVFIVFGDTMVDFNYKSILSKKSKSDVLVLGMPIDDPQNYGIMNVTEDLQIYQVEEKPKKPKSDIAIIGAYYFKSLQRLRGLLNKYHEREETVKGEYKLIQAIESYIKMKEMCVKAVKVKKWFDCGRPEVLLEANKYFLSKVSKGSAARVGTSIIIPPSFVSKNAIVEHSIVGPHVSIGAGAIVKGVNVENSIINSDAIVENVVLEESLIGKGAVVLRKPSIVNVGEKSKFILN